MAPPPEGLEVRCAGCGETLEVDPGMTEFICPDCATPQSLPPELMPPPPPRRKALPLPRAAADVRGARLPCGSCGALLSVPVGLARCACPVCGTELAIDTARLRHYLLSSATAEGAVPVVPVGNSSAPPILQAQEVHQEHPNFGICVGLLQKEPDNRPDCMEQVQAKHPKQLIPEQAYQDNPHYTSEGEEVHDMNGSVTRHTKQTNIHPVGPGTVSAEKRDGEPLNHVQHQAKVQCSTTQSAHAEDGDGVIHVQEKQQQHVNQANQTEGLCTQVVNENIAGDSNRRGVRCAARCDATENQVICAEKEESKSSSCRILKRKKKGLAAASNSGLQLRRSKRLAKDSPASIDQKHVQIEFLELPASPGGQASDTVIDNEPIHRGTVESQGGTPTSHIQATITNSEPPESDHDEQHAGSPDQSLSDSPDIDRVINDICPSPSPRQEVPEPSSNELDGHHLSTPPSSHLDLSDPEQFARNYIPPEVRKALADLGSNSLFEHTMSQASSSEACLRDLSDSEGDDPSFSTRQNVGTNRNQRRQRGLTLSLKVWTLPKGVLIPVSLNTSGEPVGKEAGTLSNFLSAIARDGILAPLIYQDWRRVPEKNKDIMWRIVKLKFDIAPIGELWIIKSLGKRWRSWKSNLKVHHFDTHETEEERLADRNPRVSKEQWRFLVSYWSTEKATAASARNRACQANVVAHHTAGTKSFARIIEEEKKKRPNKDGPTVTDLFILTHTHKNGKPTKKATADIIAQMREDSQKRAEGSGSDSTTHKSVLEFSSKGLRGKTALQASFKEAMEAKQKAEDEAAALKEKMMAMEESQRKMQEDLANLKSTVSAIDKTVPTGDLPGQQMHNRASGTNFQGKLTSGPSFPPGFAQPLW
ncbi:hypothetical protein ACQ4PT_040376 [Festuca glaucescens]